jgi:hypothetical protein
MAGTTPNGLPYPTGTDLIRDGDNAIQALAEAIDTRGGGQRILREAFVANADSGGVFSHAYPGGPFGGTPVVVATAGGAASNTAIIISLQNVDANGFSATLVAAVVGSVIQGRGGSTWIYYIAVGPK